MSSRRLFAVLLVRRNVLRSYAVRIRLARQQRQGVIVRLRVSGVTMGLPA
jgi:hypothetical protein